MQDLASVGFICGEEAQATTRQADPQLEGIHMNFRHESMQYYPQSFAHLHPIRGGSGEMRKEAE